jgi:hypothetical protein
MNASSAPTPLTPKKRNPFALSTAQWLPIDESEIAASPL